MTLHAPTFVGAAAGLATGAVLMGLAGPWAISAQNARENASSTVIACEPSERVVVRHTVVDNQLQIATECAPPVRSNLRYQNAVLTEGEYQMAAAPRVSATRARSTPASRTTSQRVEKRHDWAKTALIIGGSAGAGAGIGAMANGKKGALIGAAVGGGAATLIEAIRR